ncbi:MAG: hypothetical protein EOP11_26450 [Proteobacteria bacterium]|nr:MAG: hypothetical protein EOP11_26450 [Pseudomonadota bacterium]
MLNIRLTLAALLSLTALPTALSAAPISVRGLERIGQTLPFDGLNCWGTALYAAGLRDQYNYAGGVEGGAPAV